MMGAWSEASALCDLAIEGIRQCSGLSGPALERAWEAPRKAIAQLEARIANPLSERERAEAADTEFSMVEKASRARPGWNDWSMSAKAWGMSAPLLGAKDAASLGLGRFAALAKGMVHTGYFQYETVRLDVGGKLIKIMQAGSHLWLEKGHYNPAADEVRHKLLRMHGDWCQSVGVVADADWEIGIHAYGYGTWLDEVTSEASGGPCLTWRDKLLSACEDGLARFGRLPMKPKGHAPSTPQWMLLENYVAHSASNGFIRPQWQWAVQFPLVGASDWDRECLAKDGWADVSLLDDPLRGRGAAVEAMVRSQYGPGRELSELTQGQGRWTAQLESQMLREGLAEAPDPEKPKARARSL